MQHRGFCVSQSKLKHTSKASRGTMEGWLQRWLSGASFNLCCSRKAMANSRTQNPVKTGRGTVSPTKWSRETGQARTKKKNELSRLLLIMVCSREKWTSLCPGNFAGCCKGGHEMTLAVCVRIQEWVMHFEQRCEQSFAGNHFVPLQR